MTAVNNEERMVTTGSAPSSNVDPMLLQHMLRVEGHFAALNTDVRSLQTDVWSLQRNEARTAADIQRLGDGQAVLGQRVARLEDSVQSLTESDRAQSRALLGLSEKVAGLDVKVAGLDVKVAGLDVKVDGLAMTVKEQSHKIDALTQLAHSAKGAFRFASVVATLLLAATGWGVSVFTADRHVTQVASVSPPSSTSTNDRSGADPR